MLGVLPFYLVACLLPSLVSRLHSIRLDERGDDVRDGVAVAPAGIEKANGDVDILDGISALEFSHARESVAEGELLAAARGKTYLSNVSGRSPLGGLEHERAFDEPRAKSMPREQGQNGSGRTGSAGRRASNASSPNAPGARKGNGTGKGKGKGARGSSGHPGGEGGRLPSGKRAASSEGGDRRGGREPDEEALSNELFGDEAAPKHREPDGPSEDQEDDDEDEEDDVEESSSTNSSPSTKKSEEPASTKKGEEPGACKRLTFTMEEMVSKAAEWCDVKRLPEKLRPPKKLQGLFWMKDYIASDIAFCGSLGRWDEKKLMLTVPIAEAFMFFNNPRGKTFQSNGKGVVHNFIFTSDKLDYARVKPGPGSGGLPTNKMGMTMFGVFGDFGFKELPADNPGDLWDRTNSFGKGHLKIKDTKVSSYTAVRLIDGDQNQVKKSIDMLMKAKKKGLKDGVSIIKCPIGKGYTPRKIESR